MSTEETGATAAPKGSRVKADRRSSVARKLAGIKKALAADLPGPPSAADDAALRAAALAIHRVNELESAIMLGEAVDDATIVPLLNAAHRLLGALRTKNRKSAPTAPWKSK